MIEQTAVRRRNRAPEFTERDGRVLVWLGEQYGARLDILGVLLGRLAGSTQPLSKWGVRNQIERWKRAGLVRTERALNETWVTPTRYGLDRVGLSLNTWAVPVTRVRHCQAVNIVRLHWEAQPVSAQAPWVSERLTYQERGKGATWHIPDGVVREPQGSAGGPVRHIAIEVELTHKGRRAYETEVFANLRAGVETVAYFVPDEAFRQRLSADIRAVQDKLGSTKRYSIELLPHV